MLPALSGAHRSWRSSGSAADRGDHCVSIVDRVHERDGINDVSDDDFEAGPVERQPGWIADDGAYEVPRIEGLVDDLATGPTGRAEYRQLHHDLLSLTGSHSMRMGVRVEM
jgi:hypothetical protein